jgi:hypothetical protein
VNATTASDASQLAMTTSGDLSALLRRGGQPGLLRLGDSGGRSRTRMCARRGFSDQVLGGRQEREFGDGVLLQAQDRARDEEVDD